MVERQDLTGDQGGRPDKQESRSRISLRESDETDQKEREDEIELLFDGERPGVQERLHRRRGIEIACLPPEFEIRREQCGRREAPPEIFKIVR